MSNFRTTADLVDAVLRRSGEPTSGTSQYEADALEYLNKINHAVLAGGNIFNIDVDDTWTWARARSPMVIELQPSATGTCALTVGSEAGTFGSGPAASLAGWHIKFVGVREIYKIPAHTAAATAVELDSAFVGASGTYTFTAFKLDYELVPSYLYIESGRNDRLDFFDVAAQTEITASLTPGAYTPADLATHVAAQIATPSAAAWTGAYSATTKKFTFTSDLSGGATRQGWLGATGTNSNRSALALLGFDDENTSAANTAALTSTYILGGISRLVEPFRIFRSSTHITGVDALTMGEDYGLYGTEQGTPTRFCRVNEYADGSVWVRFNSYPAEKMKVEVEYVPVPRDLKDNAASIPPVPRKYADIYEFGAASFILLDKEDDKSQAYAGLAGQQLAVMQKHNRALLNKTGERFGEIIPRADLAFRKGRPGIAGDR